MDGSLHSTDPFGRSMGDAVINIFKVLADLDITEKRKPQDGSLSARVAGRHIDFRVATSGSVVGEKLVMRILDKSHQIIDLTQLGMRDRLREHIHNIASLPHGMLIACGPTGSGKSTTLYACLKEIDRYQKNVITVENPVEYHIDNGTQIEINPKAGKSFYRPPEPGEIEGPRGADGEALPCEHCGGTGYYGRTGIFELLVITDRVRDMIRDNPNLNAIRQEAVKSGMKYLQEDGLRQVIEGKTSVEELLRVAK